jgi:hypothetical protein
LSGLFEEADGATAGLAFGFGGHGVGGVEDGGEVVFVKGCGDVGVLGWGWLGCHGFGVWWLVGGGWRWEQWAVEGCGGLLSYLPLICGTNL